MINELVHINNSDEKFIYFKTAIIELFKVHHLHDWHHKIMSEIYGFVNCESIREFLNTNSVRVNDLLNSELDRSGYNFIYEDYNHDRRKLIDKYIVVLDSDIYSYFNSMTADILTVDIYKQIVLNKESFVNSCIQNKPFKYKNMYNVHENLNRMIHDIFKHHTKQHDIEFISTSLDEEIENINEVAKTDTTCDCEEIAINNNKTIHGFNRETIINILGVDYKMMFRTEEEDKNLQNSCGYVNVYDKIIVINVIEDTDIKNKRFSYIITVRHEILHAFLHECGLWGSTMSCRHWAMNEEMMDFFAIQWDKLNKIYKENGLLEG